MKPEDLKKLLQQPESETLEFKVRMPDMRHIVSNLVAFANTNAVLPNVIFYEGNTSITGVTHLQNFCKMI